MIRVYLLMAHLNFKKDLELSKQGENAVKDFLVTQGCVFTHFNHDNKYDILMQRKGKDVKYEVKTDYIVMKHFDTGNIFVEFECRNKPSGISVTEAEWYVNYFYYLKEFWFIKTKKLKDLILNNNIPVINQAGDANSNTKGYLIKRKDYQEYFHVYKKT